VLRLSVELKEEHIILIELAGPGAAPLFAVPGIAWEHRTGGHVLLCCPGHGIARHPFVAKPRREKAPIRAISAHLTRRASATHMESMPAAMTEVSGLSSDEAHSRLQQFGANSIPDTSVHPIRSA